MTVSSTDPYKLGDVDGNNTVNSTDARLILRFSSRLQTPTGDQFALSDVNGDGQVLADNSRAVLQFSAGLIDKLPM